MSFYYKKAGGDVGVKLTQKQEKYVQGLIKGKTQREAYKDAYNAKNMNNNTIDSKASLLFKQDKVRARYNQLNDKVIKRTEEKAIITAEEIIKGIASIAKDDIRNYLEFKTVKTIVEYDKDGEPVIDYGIVVDVNDSKDIDTSNISEVSVGKDGQFKFKLYEKDKALFKLAEIFGLNELNKAKQELAEDRFEHEKDIDNKKYW